MKRVISILIITLLFCSFIALIPNTPIVLAQEQASNSPSTIWQEQTPLINPTLTSLGDGTLYWTTTYGKYQMDKSQKYVMSYTDRYSNLLVLGSMFWLNTTATIDPAKITGVSWTASDNKFVVSYKPTYKGGELSKDTAIGTFTVTYDFFKDKPPKISVSFVKDNTTWSQAKLGDFNIVWVLLPSPTQKYIKINETTTLDCTSLTTTSQVKVAINKEDKKVEFGSYADPSLWYSCLLTVWDDVDGITVLYAGVEKVWGSKGITIVFPTNLANIDPYVVQGSISSSSSQYGYQRKGFYSPATGYYFQIYTDGTNMLYESTTDPTTWSGTSYTIRACSAGYKFSIYYDEVNNKLHYAYTDEGANSILYYRRGTPQSDGTISWDKAEQTVLSLTSVVIRYPTIAVDSGGYPWIGYYYDATSDYPYVIKSSTNDGTWTTATGFPYQLSTTSDTTWRVTILPLTSLKMYAIYSTTSNTYGKLYNSGWGSEETITTLDLANANSHSSITIGDDVYFAFLEATSYDIHALKRTYGVGWGSVEDVDLAESSYSYPVLSYQTTNSTVYCFWGKSDAIYYNRRTTSWQTTTTWIASESGLNENTLSAYFKSLNDRIGVIWVQGDIAPYVLRIDHLYLPYNTAPTVGNLQAPSTIYARQAVKINATVNDADGRSDLKDLTVKISVPSPSYKSIKLTWTESTNETSITDNFNLADLMSSTITALNSTAYRITWSIKFNENTPEGYWDLEYASIRDDTDAYSEATINDWFYLEVPEYTDVSFDSSGNPTFILYSEHDGRGLTHSSLKVNNSYYKLYNIENGIDDLYINFISYDIGGNTLKLVSPNNSTFTNISWDNLNKKFSFTATGTIKIWSGTFLAKPISISMDGAEKSEGQGWTWDDSTKTITITGSTNYVISWTTSGGGESSGGGGGGGYVPAQPVPTPIIPVSPEVAQAVGIPLTYGLGGITIIVLIAVFYKEIEQRRDIQRLWKNATKKRDVSKEWKKRK